MTTTEVYRHALAAAEYPTMEQRQQQLQHLAHLAGGTVEGVLATVRYMACNVIVDKDKRRQLFQALGISPVPPQVGGQAAGQGPPERPPHHSHYETRPTPGGRP